MGALFSPDSANILYAKYNDGIVYSSHSQTILGKYDPGVIYDSEGTPIAVYRNGKAYNTTDPNDLTANALCFCRDKSICQVATSIANFSGDPDGACAASVLYFQTKFFPKSKSADIPWTYQSVLSLKNAFSEYLSIKSILLKTVIAIAVILACYSIFQLPTAFTVWESDIFFVLLIWAAAFIYGFFPGCTHQLQHIQDFFPLLKTLFIPYLHAAWIQVVAVCIHAAIEGFFSFSYLAGMISLLPGEVFAFSIPLCTCQCIIVWYILYKRAHL